MVKWKGQNNFFDDEGKLLPDGNHLDEELWAIITQAMEFSAKNSASIDPQKSLFDFFKQKVEELYPGSDHDHQRNVMTAVSDVWGVFVGSSVRTQSLKFLWLEESLDGGRFPIILIWYY